jgi:hypothetical protein
MSADIGKGDWVECIESRMDEGYPQVLVLGARYQVEDIASGICVRTGAVCLGLLLYGVHFAGPFGRAVWDVRRFRPAGPPGADVIQSLKTPALQAVRELIEADT